MPARTSSAIRPVPVEGLRVAVAADRVSRLVGSHLGVTGRSRLTGVDPHGPDVALSGQR